MTPPYTTFSERHPLLAILIFDVIATIVAVGVGLGLSYLTNWPAYGVIFGESMLMLLLAYGSVGGSSNTHPSRYAAQTKFDSNLLTQSTGYYFGAYAFAIKYGIVGIALFVISGLLGMS